MGEEVRKEICWTCRKNIGRKGQNILENDELIFKNKQPRQ